jgi:BlaI family penicillinase repressor
MKNKTFKPTRLELELLAPLWALGTASIREIQESLPEKDRPEYTTVQTIIYRLEEKGAVERIKKIGNAHIFRPLVTRQGAVAGLVEDFLSLFAGSHQPLVTHLVESGRISSAELKQLQKLIKPSKSSPP